MAFLWRVVFIFLQKRNLLLRYSKPDIQPNPDVVHENVEKEKVSCNSYSRGREDRVDDRIPAALCLIERADAAFAEIQDETDDEQEDADATEDPFVVSVQRVCERSREAHGAEPKEYEDHRAKAAERRCDDRNADDAENFTNLHKASLRIVKVHGLL